MSILCASGIHKSFKGRQVVKNVSLQLEPGKIKGLLGPNGAGKTTTFYMMVGLIKPDQGTITLNNKDISKSSLDQRAHMGIGYLPQEPSVFRQLTVENNIKAILQLNRKINKKQRQDRCQQLLQDFQINHIKDLLGVNLSGGERRRVEIARAIAMNPAFILLDEPFAGIDPISVLDIKRMITELCQRGIGILITDHNVRETLNFCDSAIIMNAGQVICSGAPKQILLNQQVRDVYLGKEFTL